MLERTNCEIWGYDFSVGGFGKALKPSHANRAHFKQAGISGTTDSNAQPPFYTIQDLMVQNGHDYMLVCHLILLLFPFPPKKYRLLIPPVCICSDILKIDIEYAEFDAMSALDVHTKRPGQDFPIGQILIEIHLFENQGAMDTTGFLAWWEALENRGLRPAWTEPNLLAVTLRLGDGFPRLAEV